MFCLLMICYFDNIILYISLIFHVDITINNMKKYVPKEDVQKGLVDPKKPLNQQIQYKLKYDQEIQAKQKDYQAKPSKPQRVKKERPPRNQRPKFNWNKNDITLQTKAPQLPKVLLQKPNKQQFTQGLQKLKAERQKLRSQKRDLIEQQRNLIREITENKKSGKAVISQYTGVMRERFNVENQLRKQIRTLDDQKVKVNNQLESLKARIADLKKPSGVNGLSLQRLRQRIQQKQHYLTTGDITKQEENRLFNQINQLKRALNNARSGIQIESQLGKLQDEQNILYKQLKAIKTQLHTKITEANKIKAQLNVFKDQKKTEVEEATNKRTVEDIKAEYDAKLAQVDSKIQKLEDRIDDHHYQFTRLNDDYEDQQDLLNYIKWVQEEVDWLHKKKQEDDKRRKEKEEYEKRKLKQKEQYERRKEERKKQDEERKAREEERKQRLQKQREAFINRNPNYQEIQLCQNLINYCESLRPNEKTAASKAREVGEIKLGKEWQKELKSGAQIITSKKTQLDEQAPKKQLKQKKREERAEDEGFTHGIQVIGHFQNIKLLPPTNLGELDATIKSIRDKLALYSNPTEEQKAAFRERALKQFDQRNGLRDQRDPISYKQKKQQNATQKPSEKQENPKQRQQTKKILEQDFPGLA